MTFAKYADVMAPENLTALDASSTLSAAIDFQQLSDIKMNITAEFGHTKLPLKCTSELTKNSLVMLDENVDEDVKVYANGLLFARAQIVLVGENFGLRLTRIIPAEERLSNK